MNAIEKMAKLTEEIEDPRVNRTRVHNLSDILVIALLCVMSGGNGWEDMALYGVAQEDWLRQFLLLPEGIPSKDTFRRVISRLKPDQLAAWMVQWTEALADSSEGRLIAVDGKTLRHSLHRATNKAALHLVSAWADKNRLTLGQMAIFEKSNEITAIPRLLEMIDLQGAVVTIDAMGCQTAIAEQIIENGGDYILGVKGNQPRLEDKCYETAIDYHEDPTQRSDVDHHKTEEQGHGRHETRSCYVFPLPEDSEVRQRWRGAQALVQVISCCMINGKMADEVRFYLTSLLTSASQMSSYIRSHWGIENSLHWVLDVTYQEDACRIWKDHGAENLACLRRMAAGIQRREQTRQLAQTKTSKRKLSMRQKRLLSSWDKDYLIEAIAAKKAH